MDDFDFYEGLRDKTAGIGDSMRAIAVTGSERARDFLVSNRRELIGGALGAALAGGLQYHASRPRNGAPSASQLEMARLLALREADIAQARAEGRERSYDEALGDISVRAGRELADANARHPVKAALGLAPVGAFFGSTLARRLLKKG